MSHAAPVKTELHDAEARLLEIEREFQLLVEDYNRASGELEGAQTEMMRRQLIVRDLSRSAEARSDLASSLAVELYKAGNAGVTLNSLLSSRDFAELYARLGYLQATNRRHAETFARLAADASALDDELAELDRVRAEALAEERRLAEMRADIEAKAAEQRQEIAELNSELERQRALAAQRAAEVAAVFTTDRFGPEGVTPEPARAENPRAQAAVDAALSQLGKPYRWAAAGPDAYDCSGLTMWAWAHGDVELPHYSAAQYDATLRVARSDLEPGDLLFFGAPIHHVSMYIGNDQMVEAPYTGSRVRVVPLRSADYVGAGRPPTD